MSLSNKKHKTSHHKTLSSSLSSNHSQTLRFDDGAVQFRLRLAVSVLSQRTLVMKNIRSASLEPGLRPYEVSFLRLLDQMTNGSRLEINATGTQLRFVPGILTGGDLSHNCPVGTSEKDDNDDNDDDSSMASSSYRSIGWFVQGILPLAPFGKQDLTVTFDGGITDGLSEQDPSVDYWKASALPMLHQLGLVASDDVLENTLGPQIQVLRRGAAPLGGGQVRLHCPRVKCIEKPIDWSDTLGHGQNKIKRIRGTAVSCALVSNSSAARVAYAAKGVLQRLLPDVWIHTDAHTVKQHQCGPSPSLSVVLTAQSTTGVVYTAEGCLQTQQKQQRELPEDLGRRVAAKLLQQIQYGGSVDQDLQALALLFACLTPEGDVSRLRLGRLTPYTVEALRLYKQALGVEFKLQAEQGGEDDNSDKTIVASCVGTGYRNMARAST